MKHLENYRVLIAKIDDFCNRVTEDLAEHIACRPGCDGCCRHLTLFPVEAAALISALAKAPPELAEQITERARQATPDGDCPLLINGRCALYESRPVICRTHGLPLLIREDAASRLDHCPLNFKTLESIPGHLILDITPLNAMLVSVNALFTAERPATFPERERISISEALLIRQRG
ncbi:YkgJ family cysteine cluster protein [Geobacter sp. DSM 9736]|uniref:YkgJ family cysteine cluster protein n=1 Tax=Geobacter sp. DSM 9736 TaxID=1277350 RepID=UPI000B50C4E7|nr:YkgJ family cysteine cluster protein [Geobacter sp. DSM 9736]SNB46667.1 Putative zinc- or iron-chelating domain-containing protein [Geobacter sp. DSM 9736]